MERKLRQSRERWGDELKRRERERREEAARIRKGVRSESGFW